MLSNSLQQAVARVNEAPPAFISFGSPEDPLLHVKHAAPASALGARMLNATSATTDVPPSLGEGAAGMMAASPAQPGATLWPPSLPNSVMSGISFQQNEHRFGSFGGGMGGVGSFGGGMAGVGSFGAGLGSFGGMGGAGSMGGMGSLGMGGVSLSNRMRNAGSLRRNTNDGEGAQTSYFFHCFLLYLFHSIKPPPKCA